MDSTTERESTMSADNVWNKVKLLPGTVYTCSNAEFVGVMPIREILPIIKRTYHISG